MNRKLYFNYEELSDAVLILFDLVSEVDKCTKFLILLGKHSAAL